MREIATLPLTANGKFHLRKQQTHCEEHDVSLLQEHSAAACGALHKQGGFGAVGRKRFYISVF